MPRITNPRSALSLILLCGLGLFAAPRVHGAQPVALGMEHTSEAEQARVLEAAASRSYQEKLVVGRQRTEQRQENRRALIQTLKKSAEEHQQFILAQEQPAPGSDAPTEAATATNPSLWAMLLACAGVATAIWWHRRLSTSAV